MRALLAAVEAAPWVKVGGLGDVIGSLPAALRAQGIDARIALPAHGGALKHAGKPELHCSFTLPHRRGPMQVHVMRSVLGGAPIYLVGGGPICDDDPPYAASVRDQGARFTFFSLAVLELARRESIDVLHAHDWHTALAVWQLAQRRKQESMMRRMGTLLTIHNLPFAGHGAEPEMEDFGIEASPDRRVALGLERAPLTLGLAAADAINTVSEVYAREILGHQGAGMDGLLRDRSEVLSGIVNGIDTMRWDPALDRELSVLIHPDELEPRAELTRALRAELGLAPSEGPLFAIVSRLVYQKGIDLAAAALRTIDRPWQLVVLGSGAPSIENQVRELARAYPDRVVVRIGFDEPLSRRIYGGADALLMPSRYEPCGLAQMIAMRYGCVPIARETGGLASTVRDPELEARPTGILFPDDTPGSLRFGLRRAFAAWGDRERWRALQRNGMREDFSWTRAAQAYAALYRSLWRAQAASALG